MSDSRPVRILVADDDHDDCLLIRDAFESSGYSEGIQFVHDGEQLIKHLRQNRSAAATAEAELPVLILLDLNMPLKDGRETLAELKADDALRAIPVVVLSTSSSEFDVTRTYADGASSFITKPASFARFQEVIQSIAHYWLETVDLPGGRGRG